MASVSNLVGACRLAISLIDLRHRLLARTGPEKNGGAQGTSVPGLVSLCKLILTWNGPLRPGLRGEA